MSAMYSTCLFCNRPLGSNGILETFPVGKRLAFDGERGRLWVVCRRCERWNLSPLEERWEAIEDCERLFRDTRLRVSTDNIGLARVADTLELVRVGRPVRGEFAAWRYGDQFGRRRKRAIAYTTAGVGALSLIAVGGAVAGVSLGGGYWGLSNVIQGIAKERTAARIRNPDGEQVRVQLKHLERSRLVPADTPEGWELHVRYTPGWSAGFSSGQGELMVVSGPQAIPVAGKLMARANRRGGKKETIREAVRQIEAAGHPEQFLVTATREAERLREEKAKGSTRKREKTDAGSLAKLPDFLRLAVEMATQEEAERRAMEGELALLEEAWRQAEEVAAIADNLLVPRSVEEFLEREKRRGGIVVPGAAPAEGEDGDERGGQHD
jgi:hypothetical protein